MFFNITVSLASFAGGIAMSMEERIKAGELPPESVNDAESTLMGPLSGLLAVASESGIMDKLVKGAGIVGMMVVVSMTCSMFWATLAVSFGSGEEVTMLQDMLDGIMPGMPGLGCMDIHYGLLGKKIHPSSLILGTMVIGVIGVYLGIFA